RPAARREEQSTTTFNKKRMQPGALASSCRPDHTTRAVGSRRSAVLAQVQPPSYQILTLRRRRQLGSGSDQVLPPPRCSGGRAGWRSTRPLSGCFVAAQVISVWAALLTQSPSGLAAPGAAQVNPCISK